MDYKDEIRELFLGYRQELLNTEFAPPPFDDKPINPNLAVEYADKVLSLLSGGEVEKPPLAGNPYASVFYHGGEQNPDYNYSADIYFQEGRARQQEADIARYQPLIEARDIKIKELEAKNAELLNNRNRVYQAGLLDGQVTNHKRHGQHCRKAREEGYKAGLEEGNKQIADLIAQLATVRQDTAKEIINRIKGAYMHGEGFKDKIILQRQIEALEAAYLNKEGETNGNS